MTKYVDCYICGKKLIGEDDAKPDGVVCRSCMPKVVKKAKAYDNYNYAVEQGEVAVLKASEVFLMLDILIEEYVKPRIVDKVKEFLEEHTNWRR